MDYTLAQAVPNIYVVTANSYDLGLLFFRCQEYYESPLPQLYRKHFSFFEGMKWYAKDQSKLDCFSYPADWSGFNVPGAIIKECLAGRLDTTPYDLEMQSILGKIRYDYGTMLGTGVEDFYLIGVAEDNKALAHEIAHGLYYTNCKYKESVHTNLDKVPLKYVRHLREVLIDLGYNESSFADEMQAFLATGLYKTMKVPDKYVEPFVTTYREFAEEK